MRFTDDFDRPTLAEANADAGIIPCHCYVDPISGPQPCEACEAEAEADGEVFVTRTGASDVPVDAADFAPLLVAAGDDDLPF